MKLDVFKYSCQGGREYNEDYADYRALENGAVFVVADGLGGHGKGDEASSCVTRAVLRGCGEEDDSSDDPASWLRKRFEAANEELLALQEETRGKMKSTAVVLRIDGDSAIWGHVGDSRLYFLQDGELVFVTADHSVSYLKYLTGEIRKNEIGMDPDQSSLLRSFGTERPMEEDYFSKPARVCPGDAFLLCTDGVWEYLDDEEIWIDYLKSETARDWGEGLLLRVIDRITYGKNDNLTMIAIRIREG